jgi:hypothetical protein
MQPVEALAVRVEAMHGSLTVASPYHPDFVQGAHQLAGKWKSPFWMFNLMQESAVRALCMNVYGTDGTISDLVTVRVHLYKLTSLPQQTFYMLGRELCQRKTRNDLVKLGAGVVLVDGAFSKTGGSVLNPKIGACQVTLDVQYVPRPMAYEYCNLYPDTYQILDSTWEIHKQALLAERERLLERLDAIDLTLEMANKKEGVA